MSKARDRSSKQDGALAVASAAQNNFGPPPTPSAFARTMSVFRREFAAYFATPVAAVFIVMFVAIAQRVFCSSFAGSGVAAKAAEVPRLGNELSVS